MHKQAVTVGNTAHSSQAGRQLSGLEIPSIM